MANPVRNLEGQRFGKLEVLSRAGTNKQGNALWLCMCDCGKESVAAGCELVRGKAKSCGCSQGKPLHNLVGQRFGRLVVNSRADNGKNKHSKWLCRCDCGCEAVVYASSLVSGHTESCGCLRAEIASVINITHGGRHTRLYNIWCAMKQRTSNPNNKKYKDYGGRGIKVCDEWKNDFAAFRDWAIANGYEKGKSIDRIDNDSGYKPDNCRWVTQRVQMNNTRRTRFLTVGGVTRTITDWSKELGISTSKISGRINKLGWPVERALGLV